MELEELEALNNDYTSYKNILAKISEGITDLRNTVETLTLKRNYLEAKLLLFKNRLKNETKQSKINSIKKRLEVIESTLKSTEEELKTKRNEALGREKRIQILQSVIDKKIEIIKKNPELIKYLESKIIKKYERKFNTYEKEKQNKINKINKLIHLKNLFKREKTLYTILNLIMNTKKELKLCKDPIKKIELIKKINGAETAFYMYKERRNLNIEYKDIIEITDNYCEQFTPDKPNIDNLLDININTLKIQIISINRLLHHFNIALKNIYRQSQLTLNNSNNMQISSLNSDKLKWYQFIKKFKKWYNNIKEQTSPKTSLIQETPIRKVKPSIDKSKKSLFEASLKYKIVQEIQEDIEYKIEQKTKKEEKKSQTSLEPTR